ncbi:C40 family peptidase [uncultured Polaribacter sp.]|uniref:C40 family peptidase n=1 Tax=uncultured Polaribacter sp. TaxID=174711 RepID=UPI002601BD7D|nr:C40 family peptidase [uncultured Polaribacter sp.]
MNLKHFFLLFVMLIFVLSSCSTTKNVKTTKAVSISKSDKVVANALQFKGVKYKYGGITNKGMDCSGIVFVAYKKENIQLPRVSKQMAKTGKKVGLKSAKKGDLIFFKTAKKGAGINHVGLIVSVNNGQVNFIHATTSKGVIVSSLSNPYWKKAFVKVNRIL